MRIASIIISSILFGLGLEISQMTNPEKVIGFLNIFDKWDPSLMFVMVGAIVVNAVLFYLTKKRADSLFGGKISLPTNFTVDKKLLIGTALFGVGWGMAGFCPGPAISGIFRLEPSIFIVVGSMLAGMFTFKLISK
jgi:uncharacterized membrane protein YedE/YeeE